MVSEVVRRPRLDYTIGYLRYSRSCAAISVWFRCRRRVPTQYRRLRCTNKRPRDKRPNDRRPLTQKATERNVNIIELMEGSVC